MKFLVLLVIYSKNTQIIDYNHIEWQLDIGPKKAPKRFKKIHTQKKTETLWNLSQKVIQILLIHKLKFKPIISLVLMFEIKTKAFRKFFICDFCMKARPGVPISRIWVSFTACTWYFWNQILLILILGSFLLLK